MTLEMLLQGFDQLADMPDAVPKTRELIFQLAIGGRLSSQNEKDGTGADVLAAVLSEKKKYKGKLNPPQEQRLMGGDAHSFSIPNNWIWCNLATLALQIQYGYTASADHILTDIRMLRITDIQNNKVDWSSVPGCEITLGEAEKYLLKQNDILIARTGGTIGKSFIVPDAPVRSVFASYLIRVTPPQSIEAKYLKIFLESPFYWTQLHMMSAGTGQPNVNGQALGRLEFPIPPLAEQKRIVARVDELMVLCDHLEAQQKEREIRYAELARAAAVRFNDAPTPANLDFLFHNSYTIFPVDLRKSILNLAVQGRLVPRCVDDELASVLLSKIGIDRERRRNEEGVRLPKDVSLLAPEHYPYDIPDSWEWTRLGQIALRIDYGTSQRAGDDTSLVPVYRMGNIANGCLIDQNLKYVSPSIDDLPALYLQTDDILFNRTNSYELVGKTAIYKGRTNSATFASYLIRVKLNGELLCPDFFNLVMNAPYFRRTQIEPEITQQCGQANFNGTKLSLTVVPVPPLAEQRKIVARVQRLMTLVDQLEEQLAVSKAKAAELLDAVIHELLHLGGKSSESPTQVRAFTANRSDIGCYTIKHMLQNPNFGRTMLMKVLYLSEAHAGISQDWKPMRQAAGPYDPAIEDFESLGVQERWFSMKKKALSNGHEMIQYQVERGLEAKIAEAVSVLGEQKAEFDRLLNLFQSKTTEEAEIIATLFAAWNDLLIDGKSPSDEEIIREVRENWHYKKERFTPTRLTRWLNWLRQQSVIPRGLAPRTRQQLKLGLS